MNDDRNSYCACAFMDKIFVIGGFVDGVRTSFCLQFDTSNNVLKIRINEARSNAACAVFDERNVVCQGSNQYQLRLNSVETYDVLPDKWSTMPNMNSGKNGHTLVNVKNKLFVILMIEDDCEVYDNISKNFSFLNHQSLTGFLSLELILLRTKFLSYKTTCRKLLLMIQTK